MFHVTSNYSTSLIQLQVKCRYLKILFIPHVETEVVSSTTTATNETVSGSQDNQPGKVGVLVNYTVVSQKRAHGQCTLHYTQTGG